MEAMAEGLKLARVSVLTVAPTRISMEVREDASVGVETTRPAQRPE